MMEWLFHWMHRLFPYRVIPNPYGGWEHELRPCLRKSPLETMKELHRDGVPLSEFKKLEAKLGV